MTASDLARRIDHTLLKPEAGLADVRRFLTEARQFPFASVCIGPRWVAVAREVLEGSGILVCSVAGFPQGISKPSVKTIEAILAIKEGADEIDIVAHLPPLVAGDADAVKAELLEIVRGARAARPDVVIKVIVESALLMQLPPDKSESAIAAACRAVRESGCDFIKTSTGFHPAGGASVAAVALMRKHAGGIKVKAAGGIRDRAAAEAMLAAGADRLGMSSSLAMLAEIATD